jgi:serpin B
MRSRLVPTLVVLAMTAAACGDAGQAAESEQTTATGPAAGPGLTESEQTPPTGPAAGPGLTESAATRAEAAVPPEDLSAAVAGNRAFSVDAYLELASSSAGNLVLSPASIRLALAMTWAGAAGATASQMTDALHLDLPPDRMHAALNEIDALLESRNRQEPPGPDGEERKVVLTINNALWGQVGYGFLQGFLDTLAINYGAGMHLVDFQADAEAARVEINDWVADRTNDRITELIPAGVLSGLTRLVLTNAVYLDASWAHPFASVDTADGTFTTLDGSRVTVPVMHRTGEIGYSSGDGWQAVELPYVGDELAMLVLVPDKGRFDEIESGLGTILDEAGQTHVATVALGLPKWEFRTRAGLVPLLEALGMVDAFDPAVADFSPMTGQPELFVSDVIHEAFIKVDEAGTEAAAATAVIMNLRTAGPGETIELDIDRPFLFALQDRETGEVLFIGRVADPTR